MKHVESNIMIQQLGISKDNYFMGRFKILFGSVWQGMCKSEQCDNSNPFLETRRILGFQKIPAIFLFTG